MKNLEHDEGGNLGMHALGGVRVAAWKSVFTQPPADSEYMIYAFVVNANGFCEFDGLLLRWAVILAGNSFKWNIIQCCVSQR